MEQDEEEIDHEPESNQSNSLNLPEDVLIHILPWLPVKSLLRFRSVSKTWKNIIDQPHFISIHQSKMNSHLLVHYYDDIIQLTNFLLYPDQTLSRTDDFEDLNLTSLSGCEIFGPSNGIFVVLNPNERIALWNPATKQFRPLPVANRPQLPSDPYFDTSVSRNDLGFGFDPKTNDYKVFWYRGFGDHPPITQLLIYTLSTNSWRELDHECLSSFKLGCSLQQGTLCFNGVYYWLVSWGANEEHLIGPKSLLPFCFSEEQVQDEIPIPDRLRELGLPILAVCGGCVAIIFSKLGERASYMDGIHSVSVWVMVEKGHWEQKFEIGPFEEIMRPFGTWKNDNGFFENKTRELVLGDSVRQIWKNIHPFGSENLKYCLQTFVYSESLVSVKGGDQNGNGSDEIECGLADFYHLSRPSASEE